MDVDAEPEVADLSFDQVVKSQVVGKLQSGKTRIQPVLIRHVRVAAPCHHHHLTHAPALDACRSSAAVFVPPLFWVGPPLPPS